MILPIQQKDLYLHPWFTLFQDLKIGLSTTKIWYVIGYAFNDEYILDMFEEALLADKDTKLVIINPDAKQIQKKFSNEVVDCIKHIAHTIWWQTLWKTV